ncbi:MAG: alpha/beta hydrolase [Bacteroidales bacterium]|nr:alpha/beta hydrolase [Bacteroidales bacterium]
MIRKLIKLTAFILVIITLDSCLAGRYMCNYALQPTPHGEDDIDRTRDKADSLLAGSTAWYDNLKQQGILKDIYAEGFNGNRVHAVYAPAADPANANGTAVIVHGYTDNHYVFLYLVRMYRDELNYNVMVPDLQYHGYSEGEAVQMGWFDRYDVEMWTEKAHEIFNDDFTVVHGVSMGAATTMMMSGDNLPDYVKAFVEDCGYSSVWDQFTANLKQSFHLPPFPILNSANTVCRKRYGWDFKEASSVNQLAKSYLPMLFIHGDADDFVPFEHLQKNYDAKTAGYKEMWVAEGAVHANAFASHPEEYKQHVSDFLQKVKTLAY